MTGPQNVPRKKVASGLRAMFQECSKPVFRRCSKNVPKVQNLFQGCFHHATSEFSPSASVVKESTPVVKEWASVVKESASVVKESAAASMLRASSATGFEGARVPKGAKELQEQRR